MEAVRQPTESNKMLENSICNGKKVTFCTCGRPQS